MAINSHQSLKKDRPGRQSRPDIAIRDHIMMTIARRLDSFEASPLSQSIIERPASGFENNSARLQDIVDSRLHDVPRPAVLPARLWQKNAHAIYIDILGEVSPQTDALLIHLIWQILGDLDLSAGIVVAINSVGDSACRPKYQKHLVAYYQARLTELCSICRENISVNPLRLLTCHETGCQSLRLEAPQQIDHLCNDCREHFRVVLESLDELGITYDFNPFLTNGDRGVRTTFRFEGKDGVEEPVGFGGRFDIATGKKSGSNSVLPVISCALRFQKLYHQPLPKNNLWNNTRRPNLFLIQIGERAKRAALGVLAKVTEQGFTVLYHPNQDGLKEQLELAKAADVRLVLIIGQREALDGTVIVRDVPLASQETVLQKELVSILAERLTS